MSESALLQGIDEEENRTVVNSNSVSVMTMDDSSTVVADTSTANTSVKLTKKKKSCKIIGFIERFGNS